MDAGTTTGAATGGLCVAGSTVGALGRIAAAGVDGANVGRGAPAACANATANSPAVGYRCEGSTDQARARTASTAGGTSLRTRLARGRSASKILSTTPAIPSPGNA